MLELGKNIKTVTDGLIGRLVCIKGIAIKLCAMPGDLETKQIMCSGDVGIIIDVALSRRKWMISYAEPTIWYRVRTSDGIGWFDSESCDWKLIDDE